MTNVDIIPKQIYTITDRDQIKAYVHPTRMMLLRMLAKERRTISGIAKELGVHPANITHHFKLLEKVGLIRIVEKRDTGRNLEKYYRAVAYDFLVRDEAGDHAGKKALALSILKDDLSAAIRTANDDDEREVLALLGTARLSKDNIEEFMKRLHELVRDFRERDSSEGYAYNLNISLYPNDIDCVSGPESKVLF
jgi:DNA-binding transcriptional ArsR family regulator